MAQSRRGALEALLGQAEFLLVQLVVLHSSRTGHNSVAKQQHIAELHRRLDVVESQLRAHAANAGLNSQSTLGQLRRSLARMLERERLAEPKPRRSNRRIGRDRSRTRPM
jgi:ribosomal protein L29